MAVQLWEGSQGAVSEQGLSLTQPGAHQFSEARQPLSSRDAPVITSPTREHRHVLPRPLLVIVSSSPSSPPRLLQCLFVLSHSVTPAGPDSLQRVASDSETNLPLSPEC